jgi:hypothetical protein
MFSSYDYNTVTNSLRGVKVQRKELAVSIMKKTIYLAVTIIIIVANSSKIVDASELKEKAVLDYSNQIEDDSSDLKITIPSSISVEQTDLRKLHQIYSASISGNSIDKIVTIEPVDKVELTSEDTSQRLYAMVKQKETILSKDKTGTSGNITTSYNMKAGKWSGDMIFRVTISDEDETEDDSCIPFVLSAETLDILGINSDSKYIYIPEYFKDEDNVNYKIEAISDNTFDNLENLEEISLPKSIVIGKDLFKQETRVHYR